MSNLIAVAYDDVGAARNVLGTLTELSIERAIARDDAVIVEHRPDEMKPVGAATGGALRAASDVVVDDQFMKQLGEELTPGSAALIVLVRDSTPDKVLPRISPYGGRVIHSSLSDETEEQLRGALSVPAAR